MIARTTVFLGIFALIGACSSSEDPPKPKEVAESCTADDQCNSVKGLNCRKYALGSNCRESAKICTKTCKDSADCSGLRETGAVNCVQGCGTDFICQ